MTLWVRLPPQPMLVRFTISLLPRGKIQRRWCSNSVLDFAAWHKFPKVSEQVRWSLRDYPKNVVFAKCGKSHFHCYLFFCDASSNQSLRTAKAVVEYFHANNQPDSDARSQFFSPRCHLQQSGSTFCDVPYTGNAGTSRPSEGLQWVAS